MIAGDKDYYGNPFLLCLTSNKPENGSFCEIGAS